MTRNTFSLGDRVRIAPSYAWAQGVAGTVSMPPEGAQELVRDQAPWQGLTRRVKGRHRRFVLYWVTFDEPQEDADGDGPFEGAEIEAEALHLLRGV